MKQCSNTCDCAEVPRPESKENGWKVAGCSIPGTAHVRKGRVCEDSAGWFVKDDLLGIVIADGAGSATEAAIGSALATRTAITTVMDMELTVDEVNELSAKEILRIACQRTLNSISAKAEELSIEPCELASTLILVLAHRDFVVAAHVGDGAVVVNTAGELVPLTIPTNGEFANETLLLGCSSGNDVTISSVTGYPVKAIAAFTDSLQALALLMPACTPHPPFFLPLFERVADLTEPEITRVLAAFLNSSRVAARTNDDKTLIVAQLV